MRYSASEPPNRGQFLLTNQTLASGLQQFEAVCQPRLIRFQLIDEEPHKQAHQYVHHTEHSYFKVFRKPSRRMQRIEVPNPEEDHGIGRRNGQDGEEQPKHVRALQDWNRQKDKRGCPARS